MMKGIANPHTQLQRITNPLERGLQIPKFSPSGLQIRWNSKEEFVEEK